MAEFAGEGGASKVVRIRSEAWTCRGTQASADTGLAVLADEAGGGCRQPRGSVQFRLDSRRRQLAGCLGEQGVLEESGGVDRREDIAGWITVALDGWRR